MSAIGADAAQDFYRRIASEPDAATRHEAARQLATCGASERDANVAVPIRPQGASTASTDCNQSAAGTVIRTAPLDRVINIDPLNYTVTAQAGVRLYALAEALATQGLELIGQDPGAQEVRVVVVDLSGTVIDEGFGAAALEQILEAVEGWGAEPVLTWITPFYERVVAVLERSHLIMRKDLTEVVASAFQLAEALRRGQ